MSNNKLKNFIPLIIALSISFGVLITVLYNEDRAKKLKNNSYRLGSKKDVSQNKKKLLQLIDFINEQYVDTVDFDAIIEKAIPQTLSNLDPHSRYIPAKDLAEVNSELEGHFSGIGVEFRIIKDTVCINSVIKGGPSAKAGLLAGDRVITVNDSLFVGKKVTNDLVLKTFKGEVGTEVVLGVKRKGEKNIKNFSITRGDVPRPTIVSTYMIKNSIGYIKIDKFGDTTYNEFINSLAELKYNNCKGLILDLRGNGGGYMHPAIKIVNEFLLKDELIVYTEGYHYKKNSVFADGMGSCKDFSLVVLIDESSASSSEIVSGAIQDNDRGIIIGRRSFGKGLVQQGVNFDDGSVIRLTIAKYYTPSGRSIQKPYNNSDDYGMDLYNRFNHGEFFNKDSIKQNTDQVYYTKNGRTVYGGGGIMPDVFVAEDTVGFTSYLNDVRSGSLILNYAFEYTDKHRDKLMSMPSRNMIDKYLTSQKVTDKFIDYATLNGVKRRNILIKRSWNILDRTIKAHIIHNILGVNEHIAFLNDYDNTISKALEVISNNKSYSEILIPKSNE